MSSAAVQPAYVPFLRDLFTLGYTDQLTLSQLDEADFAPHILLNSTGPLSFRYLLRPYR